MSGDSTKATKRTHSSSSDEDLVDAFIAGDTRAFSEIVGRHRERLTFVARRYTVNDTDAQDIVQEALLKASTNIHNYRREAKLYTWLHKLVLNSGFDYLNHRANRENASLDSEDFDDDRNAVVAHDPTPLVEDSIVLKAAMEQLRDDQIEALYLTDVAGYPVHEVAKAQGVAPGTIKSRRSRAKEVLREAIAAHGTH